MNDINEQLAKALGYKKHTMSINYENQNGNMVCWSKTDDPMAGFCGDFKYTRAAIRCECEDWLLDNDFTIGNEGTNGLNLYYITNGTLEIEDKCIYKAVALAVIEAKK